VSHFDQAGVRVGPEEVNDPHPGRRSCHRLRIDIAGQEVRREHPGRLRRHAGQSRVDFGGSQPLCGDASDAARISHRDRQRGGRH